MRYNPYPQLGAFKLAGNGEIRFCCPFCVRRAAKVDKGFHLYVNSSLYRNGVTGWYYCHRCGAAGPASRLDGKGKQSNNGHSGRWFEAIRRLKGEFSFKTKQSIALPEDYKPIEKETEAYNYLRNRKITDEQISFYRIGVGTKNLYDVSRKDRKKYIGSGRIVFPDYDTSGDLMYWVARTYKNHKLRYKNPPDSTAGNQIYNLANASEYSSVVITEGVFSAIASGYNAVATYGKNVTSTQISMLTDAKFDKYIVALDGDARKNSIDLCVALSRKRRNVFLLEFAKDEDPASVADIKPYIDDAMPFTFKNHMTFLMQ